MIKSLKNIFLIFVVFLIAGLQILYILFINSHMNRQITVNEEQIFAINRQIRAYERRIMGLSQTKEVINQASQQKAAVLNKIPTTESVTKSAAELLNIAEANSFSEVNLENGEEVIFKDELGTVVESNYTLTYVSPFSQTKRFIESLNSSNQMINIQSLNINNEVQKEDKSNWLTLWYGNQVSEVVTTKISFSMFARKAEDIPDEIYDPFFSLSRNTKNIFLNTEIKDQKQLNSSKAESLPEAMPASASSQANENLKNGQGKFRLDVSDELTSGDTYKFLGPGNGEDSYTGLVSSVNTHIIITVKDSGYEITIEDEAGNIKQNSVQTAIYAPSLVIYSQMRQLKDRMPNVHIYIRNYTREVMNISLTGSLLENIHIYNEFDKEVPKGQKKGKVKLT